jgi:hypothetical protein
MRVEMLAFLLRHCPGIQQMSRSKTMKNLNQDISTVSDRRNETAEMICSDQ